MAKEITGYVKLQIKGGQANPAPPVGPALGQRGINTVSYTHLRAHETVLDLVCRLLLEKKVVDTIKDELKKNKLSENLGEILVPTHQVTEVKKGKRTKKEKKFFPGYVLIKVELIKQIFHLIKNLSKVSGFLGSSDKPLSLIHI